jgi:hypothetical protein
MVLAHLQRRRCWSWIWSTWWREKGFLVFSRHYDGSWSRILLWSIVTWFSVHMGCVALWVSFPKCPRSSKSEFGSKSYRRFTEEWSVTRLVTGHVRSAPAHPVSMSGQCFSRAKVTGRVWSCRELTGTSLFAVSLWPACMIPLVTCASCQYKFIHAKTSRWSTLMTCASGQFDRRVQSIRKHAQWRGNRHIRSWCYK